VPGAADRRSRHVRRAGGHGAGPLALAGWCALAVSANAVATDESSPATDPPAETRASRVSPFSTHRANYLIIGPEDSPVAGNTTSKFQLSLKYDTGANWYLAYGQRVYWDITRPSSPVLDLSFEPEVYYEWRPRFAAAEGWGLTVVHLGFGHESNGKRGLDSRAWNRAYVEPQFRWRGLFLEPRIWAITSTDDQNRDIADYAGYADLVVGYMTRSGQRWSVTGRQGTQHGSVRLDLSLPAQSLVPASRMRPYLYFQAWAGYGETLLYYDRRTTAFRVGIEFHK
jgi:outer membrane phospholipase A